MNILYEHIGCNKKIIFLSSLKYCTVISPEDVRNVGLLPALFESAEPSGDDYGDDYG